MRQRIEIAVPLVALVIVAFVSSPLYAQVSLEDQLKAQYQLVKMGEDSNGAAIVEQGTLLNVKKGGILSTPYSDQNGGMATKYQDGTVHSPNALGMKARSSLLGKFGKTQTTAFYQVGTKVYPSKIQVSLDKDQVLMGLVACDSCNNGSGFYKADVIFQFNKGALAKMSAPQVEDAISGLLAVDDSGGDQGGGDQGGGQQGGNQGGNQQGGGGGRGGQNFQGGGGGGQQQQQAPAEPQQIEKGMTPDQVKNAIGVPDKIINLGAKQIYVYKDIKVTFMNGKVAEAQ